jgi:hypothetical protein
MTEAHTILELAAYIEHEQACGVDIKLGDSQAEKIVAILRASTAAASVPAGVRGTGDSDFDALTDLVARFSAALLEKLKAAEVKYGHNSGWMRDDWKAGCQRHLNEHLAKGDPRDVAAYCAFLWHHGWPTIGPLTPEDVTRVAPPPRPATGCIHRSVDAPGARRSGVMTWWRRPKIHFYVTLRLDGKHPYIDGRRDYPDRDIVVGIHARSWSEAETQGLRCADPDYWSARVIAIAKANASAPSSHMRDPATISTGE